MEIWQNIKIKFLWLAKILRTYDYILAQPFKFPERSAIYSLVLSLIKNFGTTQMCLQSHESWYAKIFNTNIQTFYKIFCTYMLNVTSLRIGVSKYAQILEVEFKSMIKKNEKPEFKHFNFGFKEGILNSFELAHVSTNAPQRSLPASHLTTNMSFGQINGIPRTPHSHKFIHGK